MLNARVSQIVLEPFQNLLDKMYPIRWVLIVIATCVSLLSAGTFVRSLILRRRSSGTDVNLSNGLLLPSCSSQGPSGSHTRYKRTSDSTFMSTSLGKCILSSLKKACCSLTIDLLAIPPGEAWATLVSRMPKALLQIAMDLVGL